ncbi:MAG: hypothetical protein IJ897_09010 [Prevotella sp.]|nr:hypothetical protein [Prevotella sp.]MBR4572893.1 hypothetical protein [Prevotella sp.]MBR4651106.1 hypothetical protein [Prevotella sp.]
MEQKIDSEIKINERNPKILNDYLESVRDNDKERIDSTSKVLSDYIILKVKEAIKVFYKNDAFLLKSKMNEMTVCGRLAMYLQENFKDFKGYYVDIEYYRLQVPRSDANLRRDRIRCDILFHSRGNQKSRVDNLLAIEAKLEGNTDDGNKDRSRLEAFVMPETEDTPEDAIHSTLVGLFLRFGRKCSMTRIIAEEINVDIEENE